MVLVLLAQTHLWAASVGGVGPARRSHSRDRPPVGRTILVLLSPRPSPSGNPSRTNRWPPDASRLMESAPREALGRQLTKVFVPIPDGQALQPGTRPCHPERRSCGELTGYSHLAGACPDPP